MASTSPSCSAQTSRTRSPSTKRRRRRQSRRRRRAPLVENLSASTVEQWAKRAARAAVDKKADDPVVLDVAAVLAITDYFVIVSGTNTRQVRTIAEAVEEELGRDGGPKPIRIEGLDDLTWVLIDYGDLVVHVFLDETRRYYELERLWSDVPRVAWAEVVNAT